MGIFSSQKKPTDVELAYESKSTTGLCLVLADKRFAYLSNYDEHKPTLRNILKKEAEKTLPVICRFDTESKYKDSVGVYFGKIMVGWVIRRNAESLIELLKSDGRSGVGILGELRLFVSPNYENAILTELFIFA
jgi:hypothetical protein